MGRDYLDTYGISMGRGVDQMASWETHAGQCFGWVYVYRDPRHGWCHGMGRDSGALRRALMDMDVVLTRAGNQDMDGVCIRRQPDMA